MNNRKLTPGGAAAAPASIVTNGLVLEFRYDEGTGQVVTDYVNGYNAQLGSSAGANTTDPAWITEGLDFAADDYIAAETCPDSLFLGENGFTALVVANFDAANAITVLMAKASGAAATNIPFEWRTGADPYRYMGISRANTAGKSGFTIPVDIGVWRMYGVVAPQAIQTAPYMYVNACRYFGKVASGSGTGTATGTGYPLRIGNRSADFGFDGKHAYALLYNRQLSQTEVEQNYLWLKAGLAGRGIVLPAIGIGIIFDGDSLTLGTGATNGNDYPTQTTALLGDGYDRWNTGVSGRTQGTQNTDAATYVDIAISTKRARNIIVTFGGGNDIDAGQPAATVYALITTYVAARKAAGFTDVVVVTTLNRSQYDATQRTAHLALNTLIRDGAAANGYVVADAAGDARLQDYDDTTYFNADKVHLTNAGYAVVAGIVAPVIAAL